MPFDDDDLDTGQDTGSSLRKKLEAEIAKRKAAESAKETAERQLSFARAGINLEDPKTKYFVAGYDGEMDPEKIKTAATEAGFITKVEEAPPEESKQEQGTDQSLPQGPEQQLTPEQQYLMQVDQRLFGGMSQATQQQDTSGINHRAGMEKAIQDGGIEAMTAYMRNHGIPVAEDQ